MHLADTFKSICSRPAMLSFCGLVLLSGSVVHASSLPIVLGPPERISPLPGPGTDSIVDNLVVVMDNHYQPPYYTGGSPDYLSQIYILSDYFTANNIRFNPCDDNVMNTTIGQNLVLDFKRTFLNTIGSNTSAISNDRGRSWNYYNPVEQIVPLGGNVSQIVNSSLGPGLYYVYGKNGTLYAGGWGGFDMKANPPNALPQENILFTTSEDNGLHWSDLKIEYSSNSDFWFRSVSRHKGASLREFYTQPDPANPELLHTSLMFTNYPLDFNEFFGNLYYTSSKDGGKTFAPYREVYSMINDPLWREQYFDPTVTNPQYYIYGGWTLSSGYPIVYDDNILLLPVNRSPSTNPFVADQGVVRSLDKGKTWSKVAGASGLYTFPFLVYDPGFADPYSGQIIDGQLVFPFFEDSSGQLSSPVVSPSTGRIYLTYEAHNDALTLDLPATYILVTSSSDKGETFTPSVQVNRTPTNILPGAQQAFSPGAAITADGYYVVAYYDFRNWTGFPGEDITTTPLSTDVWLDVYRETEDPLGGSTGVGLDFVGEIRLTPQSFDSRIINLNTLRPYMTPYITGTPEGIPVVVNNNNELFVVFSTQSDEGVSPSNITTEYRGVKVDRNGYVNLYLQRLKFPNVSNQ